MQAMQATLYIPQYAMGIIKAFLKSLLIFITNIINLLLSQLNYSKPRVSKVQYSTVYF